MPHPISDCDTQRYAVDRYTCSPGKYMYQSKIWKLNPARAVIQWECDSQPSCVQGGGLQACVSRIQEIPLNSRWPSSVFRALGAIVFTQSLKLLPCTLFNAHVLNKQCCVPGMNHVPNNHTPNSKVILVTRVYGIKCTVVSQKSKYLCAELLTWSPKSWVGTL